MNWYKQSKFDWSGLVKGFGIGAIAALAALWGISQLELRNIYEREPEKVINKLEEVKNETNFQTFEPQEIEEPVNLETNNINLDKIVQIESSGGINNWNKNSRARGPYQFLERTWNEIVGKMGTNWDWWNGSMDIDKSRQVADYYFNKEIPRLLNYFKIPDTIETRIASYDWGIGNLKNTYEEYGEKWLENAPQETKDYIVKYRGL